MERFVPKVSEPTMRWIRFAALVLLVVLLCRLAYAVRAVFTPLLIALAIAYIVNPLVSAVDRTGKLSRLTTVIITYVVLGVLVVGGGLYLGTKTVAQVNEYLEHSEEYSRAVREWIAAYRGPVDNEGTTELASGVPTTSSAPAGDAWWRSALPLVEEHGAAIGRSILGYLATAFSSVINLVSLVVLIPMYTFFFLWRFNEMVQVVHDHLPAAYRPAITQAAVTIDAAIANFFRGRLMVCLVVGTLTGIGWSVVQVPYSLLLGLLAGVLNLVPFMSALALPPALFFTYLRAAEAGQQWALPVALTMGVYLLVQAAESFVLSPMIEGRSSGLHPIAIVVALLIGAQLGGLFGMLLAVPVASTLKTFAAQLLLPEIRRLAGQPMMDATPAAPVESGHRQPDHTGSGPQCDPDRDT